MFSVEQFQDGKVWTNWSGRFMSTPSYVLPRSVEEVAAAVQGLNGRTLRVTGAAHSFSPVALPESVALSLHYMRGLVSVDLDKQEATFWAGTYLFEMGPVLARYGLALANMGDIDVQTLAGVVSTGTHGTGAQFGSFSSMVTAWTFVDGTGEVRTVKRGDEAAHAVSLSLGLFGVLVQVTIQVVPLYSLHYRSSRESLRGVLTNFQREVRDNRHFELFYFPGSEVVQVKRMNEVTPSYRLPEERESANRKLELVENNLFQAVSSLCQLMPRISKRVAGLSSQLITIEEKVDICYEVFPTPRAVKFQEAEFALPLAQFEACLEEIHTELSRGRFNVHFPIECRVTAGEDSLLSPTQGVESAFLAFHMYNGMEEQVYFDWVFALMDKYGARPHWGKINRYDAQTIGHAYPEIEQFEAWRAHYDPTNAFMTTYFKRFFR